jgi:hypothetical protein
MVFFDGKQIIEGIDKIKIMLHPCINEFVNFKPHIDPRNRLTLHRTENMYTKHYYLSIHAEFINPSINMLENIANAIYELFEKEIITIWENVFEPIDYEDYHFPYNGEPDKQYCRISKDFILAHLEYFVGKITELEFFFDFPCECVEIYKDANLKTLDLNNDENLQEIQQEIGVVKKTGKIFEMYNNKQVIICDKSTLYSKDYHPFYRDSTLIYYDRAEKLKKYNNAMPKAEIDKNIYKKRIEFRIKNYHSIYLTINNLHGTYDEIIERYKTLLAIYYHKFFKGIVFVNSTLHKYFNEIYELANKGNKRYRGNELETIQMRHVVREHPYIHLKSFRMGRLSELIGLLNNEENRQKLVRQNDAI